MRFVVRCNDCRNEAQTWLPLLWRESCPDCAETTAQRHLEAFPGHRVELFTREEVRS